MNDECGNSEIWRGALNSRAVRENKHEVIPRRVVVHRNHPAGEAHKPGIRLSGRVNSKGGGTAEVHFFIPATDFSTVLRAMQAVDPAGLTQACEQLRNKQAS